MAILLLPLIRERGVYIPIDPLIRESGVYLTSVSKSQISNPKSQFSNLNSQISQLKSHNDFSA